MNYDILKIVGQTTDGLLVISGVYKFSTTYGIPLDEVIRFLKKENSIPSWLHFYIEARICNKKHDNIISDLSSALEDVYDLEFAQQVLQQLDISLQEILDFKVE